MNASSHEMQQNHKIIDQTWAEDEGSPSHPAVLCATGLRAGGHHGQRVSVAPLVGFHRPPGGAAVLPAARVPREPALPAHQLQRGEQSPEQ